MVYGKMNEKKGDRERVDMNGIKVDEYLREKEGKDVMMLIDKILRLKKDG
jgi:F-type H+-transporting ATPase subunit beta